MIIKTAFVTVSLLTVSAIDILGQQNNPFSEIGKEAKLTTLTNGKAKENFDDNDLQQIGMALVNIRTMKVVKLLEDKSEEPITLDNTRATRFLSVDPMTSRYSMLTPYQYASNRPIDGIDLDGLEYVTYTVVIDKKTSKIQSISYNWFNENQHNAHGSLGQGVAYDIRYYDSQKKSYSFQKDFVSRNASVAGVSTEYGNYMGATGLFELNGSGKFSDKYDYTLPAVDAVDNLAKGHDIGYDRLKAVGKTGLFGDWGTTPVDETALNGWNSFLSKYKVGDADPFNGQKVTEGERGAAWRASALFGKVVHDKKAAIATWMSLNYKNAKPVFLAQLDGKTDKNTQYNYNLFLSLYMTKDSEGNWSRIDSMWNKDEKGNYTTPIAPAK